MATIFVSPGVYTKEQDFSVFASRIGITRLGLVGKTEKGPAFEAIKVTSTDEFLLRFGNTRPDRPLTYVANSFLAQANDLTISRVLGAGGFTNSPAWIISAAKTASYTGATTVSGATFAATDIAPTPPILIISYVRLSSPEITKKSLSFVLSIVSLILLMSPEASFIPIILGWSASLSAISGIIPFPPVLPGTEYKIISPSIESAIAR